MQSIFMASSLISSHRHVMSPALSPVGTFVDVNSTLRRLEGAKLWLEYNHAKLGALYRDINMFIRQRGSLAGLLPLDVPVFPPGDCLYASCGYHCWGDYGRSVGGAAEYRRAVMGHLTQHLALYADLIPEEKLQTRPGSDICLFIEEHARQGTFASQAIYSVVSGAFKRDVIIHKDGAPPSRISAREALESAGEDCSEWGTAMDVIFTGEIEAGHFRPLVCQSRGLLADWMGKKLDIANRARQNAREHELVRAHIKQWNSAQCQRLCWPAEDPAPSLRPPDNGAQVPTKRHAPSTGDTNSGLLANAPKRQRIERRDGVCEGPVAEGGVQEGGEQGVGLADGHGIQDLFSPLRSNILRPLNSLVSAVRAGPAALIPDGETEVDENGSPLSKSPSS